MIVPPLPPLSPAAAGLARIMMIVAAGFDANPAPGTMLEGRVVRQLEPGRYAAELGGKQVTVEVQQALSPGDGFSARVLSGGARPLLELVQARPGADTLARVAVADPQMGVVQNFAPAAIIRRAFDAQGLDLNPDELAVLTATARPPADARQVAGAGVLLRRAGARISRERVQGVLEQLSGARAPLFVAAAETLEFDALAPEAGGAAPDNPAFVESAGGAIRGLVGAVAQGRDARPQASTAAGGEAWEQLLARLWSLPGADGASHGAASLNLTVGQSPARAALVYQGDGDSARDDPSGRQQRAALTLDAGALGPVQVELRLSARHLRLALRVQSAEALGALTHHDAALRAAFARQDLQIDDLQYGLRSADESDVVRAALADRVAVDAGMDLSA